jgi:subtilisin family serine protease
MKNPGLVVALALAGNALTSAHAQKINWQSMDLQKDAVFGISLDRAYQEILSHKQAATITVAVIDGGIDTAHEDLKDVLWVNPHEIPGNTLDDDHNGFTDDIHGWNFIGGPHENIQYETQELTRLLRQQQPYYEHLTKGQVPDKEWEGYQNYLKMQAEYDMKWAETQRALQGIEGFKTIVKKLQKKMHKDNPTLDDLENFTPSTEQEKGVLNSLMTAISRGSTFQAFMTDQVDGFETYCKVQLTYKLNMAYNPRSIVGDDQHNPFQRYYGNADVEGPDAMHGTHVSGIIGAVRDNGTGINGIADHVRIMMIRVVPDGDERDKDVANGIRYAVDNGAKVINMSFGKPYSTNKDVVDSAVQYAMSKDVLIVHAAGNDGVNVDDPAHGFVPTKYYGGGKGEANAWITVGASGPNDDTSLVANFSNYGKKNVDVFAPGVNIYSTVPGSKYKVESGTSMASPVVTGIAALIREYYPALSAVQVKDIILRSVVKPNHMVKIGQGYDRKEVSMSDICLTGGIVNAYNAVKLAEGLNLSTWKKDLPPNTGSVSETAIH